MCGIFCTISHGQVVEPSENARNLLHQRGPDILDSFNHRIPISNNIDESDTVCIHFTASVLALRGETAVAQPLKDTATGSVLCWNGEAWKTGEGVVSGNDSTLVMGMLSKASRQSDSQSSILRVIEQVRGPFALVYYDGHRKLYYGRDCLGRRSLMKAMLGDGTMILSSVADLSLNVQWSEVDADGLYVLDIPTGDGGCKEFVSTHISSIVPRPDSVLPSTSYIVSQVFRLKKIIMLKFSRLFRSPP
jgi:asparagine synthetase B (glutamine-hydrolysing)